MKNSLRYSFVLFFLIAATISEAQVDSVGRPDSAVMRPQVAIFIPLYLDSAYDANNNYRYDKSFPKFINPGLEFYEGARLALDSLKAEHAPLEVRIYDTRSSTQ